MTLYRGVVEDNNDPLRLGRVRVRIFGLHTSNNENSTEKVNVINKEHLPWAEIMGGTAFGLISGVGISSVLRQGTWVWVVMELENPNMPIVVGTVIGTNKEKLDYSTGVGFCDPAGVYPLDDRKIGSDLHPNATADGQYPNVSIIETPTGNIIEYCDTDDSYIKIKHNSGSFIKFDKTGNIIINAAKNLYLSTPADGCKIFSNAGTPGE